MTIITATKNPLYWAVGNQPAETGITPVGGLTISGKTLISDADPKLFVEKITKLAITKIAPDEVGSVYKDEKGIIGLVCIDKTIVTSALAVAPIEEKPVDVKVIK